MNFKGTENYDPDTKILLEITRYFLCKYFNYSTSESIALMEQYFEKYSKYINGDYITHKMSWNLTLEIHVSIGLNLGRSIVREWEIENGWSTPPREVAVYMIKNFFNRGL